MAEHGVGFVQLLDATGDDLDIDLQIARKLFLFGALVRNKFMERRVNQPDRDREAVHGFEDANEIAALERQQLVEGLDARFPVVGQDHFLDSALALMASLRLLEVGEKHVLRTAQANALRAELDGFARVLRSVNVRTDAQTPRFIGPLH